MLLRHATPARNLSSILKRGLLTSKSISRVIDTVALVQFDLSPPSPCRPNAPHRSINSTADRLGQCDRGKLSRAAARRG
jgi:hypothetical protein